jgi:hypothetical protein
LELPAPTPARIMQVTSTAMSLMYDSSSSIMSGVKRVPTDRATFMLMDQELFDGEREMETERECREAPRKKTGREQCARGGADDTSPINGSAKQVEDTARANGQLLPGSEEGRLNAHCHTGIDAHSSHWSDHRAWACKRESEKTDLLSKTVAKR